MAIQNMVLDPNAASYTDDEIVGKINTASDTISRAGSVDAAARPIAAGEISSTELAPGAVDSEWSGLGAGDAAANLDAMPDTSRGYVKSAPTTGEFPIINIQRAADGKMDIDYDDQAV